MPMMYYKVFPMWNEKEEIKLSALCIIDVCVCAMNLYESNICSHLYVNFFWHLKFGFKKIFSLFSLRVRNWDIKQVLYRAKRASELN